MPSGPVVLANSHKEWSVMLSIPLRLSGLLIIRKTFQYLPRGNHSTTHRKLVQCNEEISVYDDYDDNN